jgi:carbamoyl-phosphate synthase large subunit
MAKKIQELGFKIYSSEGTASMLNNNGVPVTPVPKVGKGKPDIVDMIRENKFDLLINVPEGQRALADSKPIRTAAVQQKVPYVTTIEAANAAVAGMDLLAKGDYGVKTIQEYGIEARGR